MKHRRRRGRIGRVVNLQGLGPRLAAVSRPDEVDVLPSLIPVRIELFSAERDVEIAIVVYRNRGKNVAQCRPGRCCKGQGRSEIELRGRSVRRQYGQVAGRGAGRDVEIHSGDGGERCVDRTIWSAPGQISRIGNDVGMESGFGRTRQNGLVNQRPVWIGNATVVGLRHDQTVGAVKVGAKLHGDQVIARRADPCQPHAIHHLRWRIAWYKAVPHVVRGLEVDVGKVEAGVVESPCTIAVDWVGSKWEANSEVFVAASRALVGLTQVGERVSKVSRTPQVRTRGYAFDG